jgi:hypothetical protein
MESGKCEAVNEGIGRRVCVGRKYCLVLGEKLLLPFLQRMNKRLPQPVQEELNLPVHNISVEFSLCLSPCGLFVSGFHN